jgi:DNA repair exonuclease SbcCD ATPase subunit
MRVLRVKFKNIGPYCDEMQEIKFDGNNFYQLIGRNGVGKSTFQDIIKYGLYGKIDNGSVGDLANENNPDGYIEVEYEVGGEIMINKWYFNPNKVKVFLKDGNKAIDTGGIDATRSWLEKKFGIPFTVFANTLSISISDFKSFVKMSASDTRNIRDKIFGFDVINDMAQVIKNTIQTLSSEETVLVSKMASIEENMTNIKEQIESNDVDHTEIINQKIGVLNAEIGVLNNAIAKISSRIEKLYANHKEAAAGVNYLKYMAIKGSHSKMLNDIQNINNDINIVTNAIDEKTRMVMEYNNDIDIINHNKKVEEARANNEKVEYYRKQLMVINSDIKNTKSQLTDTEKKISTIESIIRDNDLVDTAKNAAGQYVKYKKDHDRISDEISSLNDELSSLESIASSIKRDIIDHEAKAKTLQLHIETHRNGHCDKCGSEFDAGDNRLEELELNLSSITSTLDERKKSLADTNAKIAGLKNDIDTKSLKASDIYSYMMSPKAVMSQFLSQDDIIDADLTTIHKKLDSNKKHHDDLQTTKNLYSRLASELSELEAKAKKLQIDTAVLSSSMPDDMELKERVTSLPPDDIESAVLTLKSEIGKLNVTMEDLKTKRQDIQVKIGINESKMAEAKCDKPDGFSIKNASEAQAYIDEKQLLMRQIVVDGTEAKNELEELKKSKAMKQMKIDNLKEDLDNSTSNDSLKKIMNDYERKYNDYRDELREIKTNLNYNNMAYACLMNKEGSIKSYILKEIVPFINLEVNGMLEQFQISLYVEFNADFVPNIIRNGRGKAGRISAGQKKMLDFATILAIIKIIKLKYNSVNMIFYDEIFSSIDAVNRVVILETLSKITKELGVNIVVVNHSALPTSYFDYIAKVSSDGIYSRLSCEPSKTFQE